jgi:hypothetical protein
MKTFTELTSLALAARQSNTARADFLASLAPEDRSNAAMQFDRAGRLETIRTTPPTEQQIAIESRRIARTEKLAELLHNHPAYLSRLLSGRIVPAWVQKIADGADAMVTHDDISAAREQAIENLNGNRNYLAARLTA